MFSIIWWFLLSSDNWFTPYMSSKQWLRKTLPQVYRTKRWFVLNENPLPIWLSVVSPLGWLPWNRALWGPTLIPSPPVYPHLTHTHYPRWIATRLCLTAILTMLTLDLRSKSWVLNLGPQVSSSQILSIWVLVASCPNITLPLPLLPLTQLAPLPSHPRNCFLVNT